MWAGPFCGLGPKLRNKRRGISFCFLTADAIRSYHNLLPPGLLCQHGQNSQPVSTQTFPSLISYIIRYFVEARKVAETDNTHFCLVFDLVTSTLQRLKINLCLKMSIASKSFSEYKYLFHKTSVLVSLLRGETIPSNSLMNFVQLSLLGSY